MLKKIRRLERLGIFSSHSWDLNLQDFGRYNLIYGWNGSGKTTLCNLFAALSTGSIAAYPELDYEVETATGILNSGEALASKIRVFNQAYVTRNVNTVSGKASPVLVLGEANKKVADDIAADEAALATKLDRVRTLEEKSRQARAQRNKLFSDIAKTIGLNTSGLATRNYRKPDAEKDFDALEEKSVLDDQQVAAQVHELKQLARPDVPQVAEPRLRIDKDEMSLEEFLSCVKQKGDELCAQIAESKVIERLSENADIAQWVEEGVELHKRHVSQTCEFCGQGLPSERMNALSVHFSDADRKLKNEIDALLSILDGAITTISTTRAPDKANLYDELQNKYQVAVDEFTGAKRAVGEQVQVFRQAVAVKKTKTTVSIRLEADLDGTALGSALANVNTEIRKHNEKTAHFNASKNSARKKLEVHYLSMIYDDVKALEKTIAAIEAELKEIQEGHPQRAEDVGIVGLTERIRLNRLIISSTHRGCEQINSGLKTFLGRGDLQFEVEEDGYILMRDGKLAENLSEGEKTAIGFVHFVNYLKEHGFDPATGIVVIDDPVSSLDSNSIFEAFAFLKNAVKDAKQVFVLTHNFDFLRLLINWVKNSRQKVGYYMLKNTFDDAGVRTATIDVLDKLLREHETEYHYLFKLLYLYQSDGTIESAYKMPNIARKVLETFLMFRVPSGESMYMKLETLRPLFDGNKLTAIYKFTNDQSHVTGKGFDPSLVPETQKSVKYLLEMIEIVFPEHYKILVSSISS